MYCRRLQTATMRTAGSKNAPSDVARSIYDGAHLGITFEKLSEYHSSKKETAK